MRTAQSLHSRRLSATRHHVRPKAEIACRHTHSFCLGSVTATSLVDLLDSLLLERSGLVELKSDLVGGEAGVGVGHGVKLILNKHLVQRVQVDGGGVASLLGDASATSDNAGGNNDIVEDLGMDGLESTGSRSLLGRVGDLSLGVNGSVDNHDDGPVEFGLEVLDHLLGDLLVEHHGSEGDLDKDVLAAGAIITLELALLDGVEVDHAEILGEVSVGLLEGGEGLGALFLDLGGLLAFLLLELGSVEHCDVV